MAWVVEFHDKFVPEFEALPEVVQTALMKRVSLLIEFGPNLALPWAKTLAGSKISNLKELRFDANDGVWRVLFAFNRKRVGVLLAAGDKSGVAQAKFYKRLISQAERRWFDG